MRAPLRLEAMAPSHEHLDKAGDFHVVRNPELAAELLQSFYKKPAGSDLVNICTHWYRRPPYAIAPQMTMGDDLGRLIRIQLANSPVSGAW